MNINVIELTDKNFEEVVMKSNKPVIIDFWAEWCGPCRMVAPIIDEIANEYQDRVVVTKCNVDESPTIGQQFHIRNIPTVLFLKDGNILNKQVGAVPKSLYINKISELL